MSAKALQKIQAKSIEATSDNDYDLMRKWALKTSVENVIMDSANDTYQSNSEIPTIDTLTNKQNDIINILGSNFDTSDKLAVIKNWLNQMVSIIPTLMREAQNISILSTSIPSFIEQFTSLCEENEMNDIFDTVAPELQSLGKMVRFNVDLNRHPDVKNAVNNPNINPENNPQMERPPPEVNTREQEIKDLMRENTESRKPPENIASQEEIPLILKSKTKAPTKYIAQKLANAFVQQQKGDPMNKVASVLRKGMTMFSSMFSRAPDPEEIESAKEIVRDNEPELKEYAKSPKYRQPYVHKAEHEEDDDKADIEIDDGDDDDTQWAVITSILGNAKINVKVRLEAVAELFQREGIRLTESEKNALEETLNKLPIKTKNSTQFRTLSEMIDTTRSKTPTITLDELDSIVDKIGSGDVTTEGVVKLLRDVNVEGMFKNDKEVLIKKIEMSRPQKSQPAQSQPAQSQPEPYKKIQETGATQGTPPLELPVGSATVQNEYMINYFNNFNANSDFPQVEFAQIFKKLGKPQNYLSLARKTVLKELNDVDDDDGDNELMEITKEDLDVLLESLNDGNMSVDDAITALQSVNISGVTKREKDAIIETIAQHNTGKSQPARASAKEQKIEIPEGTATTKNQYMIDLYHHHHQDTGFPLAEFKEKFKNIKGQPNSKLKKARASLLAELRK